MEKRLNGTVPSIECRRDAHDTVDKQKRYRQIIECFNEIPEMTARELASYMCLKGYTPNTERTWSQPRITELCMRGVLEQRGKTVCKTTGKKVTVYGLTEMMRV